MLRLLSFLVVLCLAAAAPLGAQAPGDPVAGVERGIEQLNTSGQVGSVHLFSQGASTLVVVRMDGAPGHNEALTVHRGRDCQSIEPKAVSRLADLVNGRSRSTASMSIDRLLSGNYVLVVSNNTPESRAVACGHLYLR